MNQSESISNKCVNHAYAVSKKRTLIECVILIASGFALTLSFPGINFAPPAWLAVVPLMWLCCRTGISCRRAFLYGMLWGYCWNLSACFFLREIMFFIPFIFAVILGLFSAVWASAIPIFYRTILLPVDNRLDGSAGMKDFYLYKPWAETVTVFALASWWIGLEWVRSWIFTGFPWNLLAATQWKNFTLIQICEYTGIYGVSFIVILMNLAVYFALHGFRYSLPEGRYKRPYPVLTAGVLLMLAMWFGNQTLVWRKAEFRGENQKLLTVGIVQPHLSQRRFGGEESGREALNQCLALSRELLQKDKVLRDGLAAEYTTAFRDKTAQAHSPDSIREVLPLDFIVWPESAVPYSYYSGHPVSNEYREGLRQLMMETGVPFLTGSITYADIKSQTDYKVFNSAVFLKNKPVDPKNPYYDLAAIYSKVHLVPYGEFIPLNDTFPFLGEIVGMGRDLTPGKTFLPIEVKPGFHAGVLICYEDVFAYAARAQALAGANLLLVITNDAWYPTSFEPEQHYANAIFRTIETRLPMVRCGNSNYSVLIDPRGKTVDSVFKRIDQASGNYVLNPGVKAPGSAKFLVPVPKEHAQTFYTRYGNVFVLLCWLIFAAGCAVALCREIRFRKALANEFNEKK